MVEEQDYPSDQSPTNKTPSSQGKQSAPGNQQENLEELVNRALEQKQTIQSINQLRTRVGWLTGLFIIAIIILGGGLGWASYRLQQQQKQIAQQNQNPENLEKIQQLEDQIKKLQQQVPDPKTIEDLKTRLDEVTTTVEENQKTLEQVLEDTQNQQASPTEQSESNSPDFQFSTNETETSN